MVGSKNWFKGTSTGKPIVLGCFLVKTRVKPIDSIDVILNHILIHSLLKGVSYIVVPCCSFAA